MTSTRDKFWALETLEEVTEMAKNTFENINSQRWVIWEWKRRMRDGRPPRGTGQQKQPKPTKKQQIINEFLMSTSIDDLIKMKNELGGNSTTIVETPIEPEPEPTENVEPISSCKCGQNDFEMNDCNCDICFECFEKLFNENKKNDIDQVEIKCPHCGKDNIYNPDYFE